MGCAGPNRLYLNANDGKPTGHPNPPSPYLPAPGPPLLSHPLFGQQKEIALNVGAFPSVSPFLLLATRAV